MPAACSSPNSDSCDVPAYDAIARGRVKLLVLDESKNETETYCAAKLCTTMGAGSYYTKHSRVATRLRLELTAFFGRHDGCECVFESCAVKAAIDRESTE